MRPEKIVVSAASGLGPAQQGLTALAAGIDMRFVHAGTTLATAVETIARVIGALDTILSRLDAATAGAVVATLRNSARRLEALPALQAGRVSDIGGVRCATAELHARVMRIHEVLRILRVNGTNLRMIASGSAPLAGSADALFAGLDTGDAHLGAFMSQLRELATGIASVQRGARLLAAECDRVIPDVPDRLADDALALQAHQALVATSTASLGRIARDVQGRVATVLGALQIGDITRQRIEHMAAAMQLLAAAADAPVAGADAVAAHVRRLIAAQLADVAEDFERETQLLLGALGELGPEAGRLLALMRDGEAGGEGRRFLQRLEQGIADIDAITGQLRAANACTRGKGILIDETLEALAHRLDGMRAVRAGLDRIAAEAQAHAGGMAAAGRPAVAVAEEIAACAGRLDHAIDGVAAAIGALRGASRAIRHHADYEAQVDAGLQIGRSLVQIREGLRCTELGIGEGSLDAGELAEMLDEASGRLARELELGGTIRRFAAQVLGQAGDPAPLPEAAEPALRALLDAIGALYTMAREREVHREFLLPGMEWQVGAASSTGESWGDDGLF